MNMRCQSKDHLSLKKDPAKLLFLTIGILGDYGRITSEKERKEFIAEKQEDLIFSAQYFDSYCESRLNLLLQDYFLTGWISFLLFSRHARKFGGSHQKNTG